jgi:hypothetical protein
MSNPRYLYSTNASFNAAPASSLRHFLEKNEAALNLYTQSLTAILPENIEVVNQLSALRRKELDGVTLFYSAAITLNLYYKVNEISDLLSKLSALNQQIIEMKEKGLNERHFYQSVQAVYENALNATITLLSSKKINSDLMLTLNLLKKVVEASTSICMDPDNQQVRDFLSPSLLKLSQECDKILCPTARKVVAQTIILFAVGTLIAIPFLILMPSAILSAPGIFVTLTIPLLSFNFTWNDASKQGMSFWNKETSSLLKPLVKSLNTFFKTQAEEKHTSSNSEEVAASAISVRTYQPT